MRKRIIENFQKYRFEFRHITVLFVILISFQIIISIFQKSSMHNFLHQTQNWYQKDAAEKIADLTTTPIELIIETSHPKEVNDIAEAEKIIQSFDIILSQQLLHNYIDKVCLILTRGDKIQIVDDGRKLFNYLQGEQIESKVDDCKFILDLFDSLKQDLREQEKIISVLHGENHYHIFVPFVPNGEYLGVLYMKRSPDFSSITAEVIMSYNEVAIIYSSLVILGLLAMYYISSYTVKERNTAQQLLFEENEKHIKEEIKHQKESLFTKRIYHTHHKAEKIMGFIKEDLRKLTSDNTEEIKNRVIKYSNFISRVIYDMKWYDPPLQTIRNQTFNTNLNDVIRFLINHTFLRISTATDIFKFELDLDDNLPTIYVNEFVTWEIIEPLIQNCIDHANKDNVVVEISTSYDSDKKQSTVIIADNGIGIAEELLDKDEEGIKLVFSENISTRKVEEQNKGYGCYIAYQMAVKRCGWKLDVTNQTKGGAEFKIVINH